MTFTGVSARKAKRGRVNSSGLAGLNNFSWCRDALCCLVPGLGMIKAKRHIACGGTRGRIEGAGLWSVRCMCGRRAPGWACISAKDPLALQGVISLLPERFSKVSIHHTIQKI